MRKFIFLLFNILLTITLLAGPVDRKQARQVAANFFSALTGQKGVKFDKEQSLRFDGTTTMYIFARKNGGFVITSADDNVKPIIAYSSDRDFPLPIQSPEVKWWLNLYAEQIKQLIDLNIKFPENKNLWTLYLKGKVQIPKAKVGPLVKTTWDQTGGDDQYPFNYFCPHGTPVGCVAAATAQIMKYWNYPPKGRGWHTYVHPKYGRLSATFDTTTFSWDQMPLDGSNFDVALLSYEVGVALDMDYDVAGSGAFTFDLTYVLPNYFLYSDSIMYYSRSSIEKLYGKQAWIDSLKKQIDLGYPMVYAGYGDQGGHAFVCDGYNDQSQFHFNWGWSGSYDGWFDLDNLTPGSSDFSKSQSAVMYIHKPTQQPSFIAVKTQSPFAYDENSQTTIAMRYIDGVDKNIAYAVPSNSAGIGKTTTGGATWKYIPLANDYKNYGISMVYALNKDTLFIPVFASSGSDNTFILRSKDGGKSWEKVLEGSKNGTSFFNVIHFFDDKHGVVQGDPVDGDFEIYVTDDGGDTWTRINGDKIPDAVKNEYGTVGYYFGDSINIWFFTTKGRVFRSMDKGQNWTVKELMTPTAFGDPDDNDRTDIAGAVLPNGLGTIVENYYEYTATDTTVHYYYYYTEDYGDHWNSYTPNDKIIAEQIRPIPGMNGLVAVGIGIHYTLDGQTWASLPNYYNLFYIYSIDLVDNDYGYMGSNKWTFANGAWILGFNNKAIPNFKTSVERTCQGSDVEFYSTSLGMVSSISWNFGKDASPSTATGPGPHTVTYSSPGTKNITMTVIDQNGNTYTLEKIFTVDAQAPNYLAQINGEPTPLLNNSYTYSVEDKGDKYKWSFPSIWKVKTPQDSSAKEVLIKGTLGQKEIKVTPYNGCGQGQQSTLIVTVIGGVNKPYPNPSSNIIYIENTEDCSVYIYNNTGKLIDQITNASYLTQINVADPKYKSGIYTVMIVDKDGNKRSTKILVVK